MSMRSQLYTGTTKILLVRAAHACMCFLGLLFGSLCLADGHEKGITDDLLRDTDMPAVQADLQGTIRGGGSHSSVRGTTSLTPASPSTTSTALSGNSLASESGGVSSNLERLDHTWRQLDGGLDHLRKLIAGESETISAIASSLGMQAQDLSEIIQFIDTEHGLSGRVEKLNALVQVDVMPIITKLSDALSVESTRRLSNIFDEAEEQESFRPSGGPDAFDFSEENSSPEGYSFFGTTTMPDDFVRTMFSAAELRMPRVSSKIGDRLGYFSIRNHRRGQVRPGHRSSKRKSEQLRRLQSTESQATLKVCDERCNQEDANERKECNCDDLIDCAERLRDTDLVVLFARGLVDEANGVIEVEKENLSNAKLWSLGGGILEPNGALKKERNAAFRDTYDAGRLLLKMNTIRSLAAQKKCDELLDEFHVACKDWQDGCSGSDGRSYRLTIDEICDAIDSSERITFASMSQAFDTETSRQDSCNPNDYVPSSDDLIQTAQDAANDLLLATLSLPDAFPKFAPLTCGSEKAKQQDYRGKSTANNFGATCDNWRNLYPGVDRITPEDYRYAGLGDHNYCRNPDGKQKAWCYVAGSENPTSFTYCEVPFCTDSNPLQERFGADIAQRLYFREAGLIQNARDFIISKSIIKSNTDFVLGCLGGANNCNPLSPATSSNVYQLEEGGISFTVVNAIEGGETFRFTFCTSPISCENIPSAIVSLDLPSRLPSAQAFQKTMIDAMKAAVEKAAKDPIEDCYRSRCSLDTKVGLKSCEEMIECSDKIWEAGQSPANASPNPYAFTLPAAQSESQVNAVKNTEWNSNLALGKTAMASSVRSISARYVEIQLAYTGTLYLREVVIMGYDRYGGLKNIALGKAAEQSCDQNLDENPASLAADGNVEISSNGFSATCEESEPWWRVDLGPGSLKQIDSVTIFNRNDSVQIAASLRDFNLRFLDDSKEIVEEIYQENPVGDFQTFSLDRFDPYFAVDGRDDTHWQSEDEASPSITINLGRSYQLGAVKFRWVDGLLPTNFNIFAADTLERLDETSSTTFTKSVKSDHLVETSISDGSGQFVQIKCSGACGIYEVEVYAKGVDPNSEVSKLTLIAWPEGWNLVRNRHGLVEFPNPKPTGAIIHREGSLGTSFNSKAAIKTTFPNGYRFEHEFDVDTPTDCGLDVREDTRCDDARTLLFGESTSVGQICSIADAVTVDPNNMPGICCLDGITTTRNFGERYACGQTCQVLAPYPLGISEEACAGQVGGTWCRRPCTKLQKCTQNKPKREKCRVAAKYEIKEGSFALARSGYECDNDADAIYLAVSCRDEEGNGCSLPAAVQNTTRRSLSEYNSSMLTEGSFPALDGTDVVNATYKKPHGVLSGSNATSDSSPTCENKTFTFQYTITFASSAEDQSIKDIIHFIKARNGSQTDLFKVLGGITSLSRDGSPLVIESKESLTLCSNDGVYSSLVTIDLENASFNEAFDVFSKDMLVIDANDEDKCQKVRDLLGFSMDYIDDFEICREFDNIRCEFDKIDGSSVYSRLNTDRIKGGDIPDFRGFEFQPLNFDGFDFEGTEFVGFEFAGFGDAEDLNFVELMPSDKFETAEEPKYSEDQVNDLEISIRTLTRILDSLEIELNEAKDAFEVCPFPFIVVLGSGSNSPCVIYEQTGLVIKRLFAFVFYAAKTALLVMEEVYEEEYADSTDEGQNEALNEATYENIFALNDNLDIINSNMNTQHISVRSTLESQHVTMMGLLSTQHTEIGEQLTNQHNRIGDQLTKQHTSIGDQLTEQHNSIGKQLTEQHNSVGIQLTDQHKKLSADILEVTGVLDAYLQRIGSVIESIDRKIEDIGGTGTFVDTTAVEEDGTTSTLQSGGFSAGISTDREEFDTADMEVEINCLPPHQEARKARISEAKVVILDILVSTQWGGKDYDADISQVIIVYTNKKGDYRSQVGRIEKSMPMSTGMQVLSLQLDREEGDGEDSELQYVTSLRVTAIAIENEKTAITKSVTFDYSECHERYRQARQNAVANTLLRRSIQLTRKANREKFGTEEEIEG